MCDVTTSSSSSSYSPLSLSPSLPPSLLLSLPPPSLPPSLSLSLSHSLSQASLGYFPRRMLRDVIGFNEKLALSTHRHLNPLALPLGTIDRRVRSPTCQYSEEVGNLANRTQLVWRVPLWKNHCRLLGTIAATPISRESTAVPVSRIEMAPRQWRWRRH